jgi:hypothetical protein
MVKEIMSWLETKMQLVISHMPLLARGQQVRPPKAVSICHEAGYFQNKT